MKRYFCFALIIFMAFSFSACASNDSDTSNTPLLVEETTEPRISDWNPIPIYDDFGEKKGYSTNIIEYNTSCSLVGEENGKKLPVVFDYVQQPNLQGFNIAIDSNPDRGVLGRSIKDLRYKIDGETYEILRFDNIGLWRDEHKEDFERIYNALIDGKDIAFSVVIWDSSTYHKFTFTVSGFGFADVAYEYLD